MTRLSRKGFGKVRINSSYILALSTSTCTALVPVPGIWYLVFGIWYLAPSPRELRPSRLRRRLRLRRAVANSKTQLIPELVCVLSGPSGSHVYCIHHDLRRFFFFFSSYTISFVRLPVTLLYCTVLAYRSLARSLARLPSRVPRVPESANRARAPPSNFFFDHDFELRRCVRCGAVLATATRAWVLTHDHVRSDPATRKQASKLKLKLKLEQRTHPHFGPMVHGPGPSVHHRFIGIMLGTTPFTRRLDSYSD